MAYSMESAPRFFEMGQNTWVSINHGKEDGRGTLTWPNGVQYEGEFTDGLCSGVGNYTYKNKKAEQTPNFQIDCKSKGATTL